MILNKDDPDYYIELFWYNFKESMINFYSSLNVYASGYSSLNVYAFGYSSLNVHVSSEGTASRSETLYASGYSSLSLYRSSYPNKNYEHINIWSNKLNE
jgi:hypothetical protein